MKLSTQAKIAQRVTELLYPAIVTGKNYIFSSHHGRVERFVVSVGRYVLYRKPSGFGQCPLATFQRLYEQYGVEEKQ
ncbi:hypothetical protein EHS13_20005 [Paenibacillus psychroresistens]|uniref:Uncharacterized protein n=1 Tax=Paenibacillus psychroresistens TaxID=1778678 RepID=A0A6B8RNR2_9BACL|nr:hypothetical protein [Paenibacillus psychroresistens]QGQ97006.1 hypothetical protein EHS13_20005 [Paenibacillus psychroresistens]